MARIFPRGQNIVFRHTFYDSSGDITSPTTARLTVSYPTYGWPFEGALATTTITMVQSTVGSTDANYLTWSATWESAQAYPGPVHWHIRANDLSLAVADGEITLRGNPANLSITTTT